MTILTNYMFFCLLGLARGLKGFYLHNHTQGRLMVVKMGPKGELVVV